MIQYKNLTPEELEQLLTEKQDVAISISKEELQMHLPNLDLSDDPYGFGKSITPINDKESIREMLGKAENVDEWNSLITGAYLADGEIFVKENGDDEYTITIKFFFETHEEAETAPTDPVEPEMELTMETETEEE